MFLRITIGVISNCLPDGFWMLQTEFACCSHKRVRDTNEVTPLGTSEQHRHNRDERCKQIREGGVTETTTVTDMAEVDQQG